jgi:hypothetical protein
MPTIDLCVCSIYVKESTLCLFCLSPLKRNVLSPGVYANEPPFRQDAGSQAPAVHAARVNANGVLVHLQVALSIVSKEDCLRSLPQACPRPRFQVLSGATAHVAAHGADVQ